MRKKARILCYLLTTLVCFSGCKRENNVDIAEQTEISTEVESSELTILDIENEANSFEYSSSLLDFSSTKWSIPSNDMKHIVFDVEYLTSGEVERRYINNLKQIMGKSTINEADIYLNFANEDIDMIKKEDASEEQRNNRNSCMLYSDGRYSEVLYKSSYMCELADNSIPVEVLNDSTDYAQNKWGYRGLDLGSFEKVYNIKADGIPKSTYKLYDKEVSVKDAIDFVEGKINDYSFCGSTLLNYKANKVTVYKLADGCYYYQIELQPYYKDAGLDIDYALSQGENDTYFAEGHVVSMYQSDKIGYFWSSCNTYDKIKSESEVKSYISIKAACKALEATLKNKKKFEISSVEMIYKTKFIYDDNYIVLGVEARPVYHFVVGNPRVTGYSALYFDVDVEDGSVMVSYMD